jgi:hypothetical protein
MTFKQGTSRAYQDQANQRPAHRPALTVDNDQTIINTSDRPTGTSVAAALRRLRKDMPAIHARVLAGEITAHAGMVEEHVDFDAQAKRDELRLHGERAPLAAHGEIGGGHGRGDYVTSVERGNTAAYLAARLRRDHPEIAAQLGARG